MADKDQGMFSHTRTREKSSKTLYDGNNALKNNADLGERVDNEHSITLTDARATGGKPLKAKGKQGAKRRKRKTAAEKRVSERVPVSAEGGAMAGARRYVDMVEMMHRRRQLDARQYQAATLFREAAEAASGGIPCALDMTRYRGGSGPGSPTEAQMRGAEVLRQAQHLLGQTDGAIVTLAVVEGLAMHEVAGRLFRRDADGRVRRADAEHAGRRFREALSTLADAWWPEARKGRIRAVRDADAGQTAYPASGHVEPGVVAHARPGRVRYTGTDKVKKEG